MRRSCLQSPSDASDLPRARPYWEVRCGGARTRPRAPTASASGWSRRTRSLPADDFGRSSRRGPASACSKSDPAPATTRSTSPSRPHPTGSSTSSTSSKRCSTTPGAAPAISGSTTSPRRRATPATCHIPTTSSIPAYLAAVLGEIPDQDAALRELARARGPTPLGRRRAVRRPALGQPLQAASRGEARRPARGSSGVRERRWAISRCSTTERPGRTATVLSEVGSSESNSDQPVSAGSSRRWLRRACARLTCSPAALTVQAAGIRWVCPPSFQVAGEPRHTPIRSRTKTG